MRRKHSTAFFIACALLATSTMCADEPKQTDAARPPLRVETKNVVQSSGPLAYLQVIVEIDERQHDLARGLSATVVITNSGVDPIEIVNPALLAKIDLSTADGRDLEVVRTAPSIETRGVPVMVKLEPGEEHRVPVFVREVVVRPAAPPVKSTASKPEKPATLPEAGTMSTAPAEPASTAEAAALPPPSLQPLAPGRYRVRVHVGLGAPPKPDGTRIPIRYVMTDPVTVSYGMN